MTCMYAHQNNLGMIICMLSLILISSAKVNFFDCFEPPDGKEVHLYHNLCPFSVEATGFEAARKVFIYIFILYTKEEFY